MYQIKMDTSSQYDIYIENGILDKINEYLGMVYHEKNVYIITDERVASFYLDRVCTLLIDYNVKSVVIKGYEESKVLETYADVCSQLIDLGISRNEMLIALGGGVIGDLVGFVAATLYRGVPFIQIPTSLLAQVDSSIGGKTGIDFKGRKNILGAFNQPKMVLIDPLVLMTLPEEQLKNGYGEMIKHALIGSKKLFNLLEDSTDVTEEIIYENLSININNYIMKVNGAQVDTPPKELELIYHLAGHPNRVFTRNQLLDEVWGFDYYGDSRTVDVHVKRLREKLEGVSEKWALKTVWGVGYKFETID